MSYEYRLENVDPDKSSGLLTRIEEQDDRERKAWDEVEDDEPRNYRRSRQDRRPNLKARVNVR